MVNMLGAAPILGSIACLGVGLVGLVRPRIIASRLGITSTGPLGTTGLRALFGGVFSALGTMCLVYRHPMVYFVVGLVMFAVVAVKLVSMFIDSVPWSQILPGMVVDLIIGLLLASGRFSP